jgi:hypothetical protein
MILNPAFRCSELDRVLTCHGSIKLVPMVNPREGDEGLEGEALHFTSARRMVLELGATPPEGAGLGPYRPHWPKRLFNEWISEYYFRHVRDNVPADWSLEVEAPLAYEFPLTRPVHWTGPDGVERLVSLFSLSGHPDAIAISPCGTKAIGWDLKTGYDPVEPAEQNWQMLGYIVLLKRAYPGLKEITFYVVQPRNDEDEGFEKVSKVHLTSGLEGVVEGLRSRLEAALHNTDEINSGRIQCKWCPVAPQCPAVLAERDLMKIKLTPEALAKIHKDPDPKVLADWVIIGKTLERPIKDTKELAGKVIAKSQSIVASDGTVISQKVERGSYKITNPVGLWNTVAGLLPETRRAVAARWSMSELKDQIAAEQNCPKTGQAPITAEKIFDAQIRLHVEQGEKRVFQFQ